MNTTSTIDRLNYRMYRLGELQLHSRKIDDTYFRIMARTRQLHTQKLKMTIDIELNVMTVLMNENRFPVRKMKKCNMMPFEGKPIAILSTNGEVHTDADGNRVFYPMTTTDITHGPEQHDGARSTIAKGWDLLSRDLS